MMFGEKKEPKPTVKHVVMKIDGFVNLTKHQDIKVQNLLVDLAIIACFSKIMSLNIHPNQHRNGCRNTKLVFQRLSKCPDLTAVKTLVWIEEGSPHVQTWEYDRG